MGKSVVNFCVVALWLALPAWADPIWQANLIEISRNGQKVEPAPEVRLVANADRDAADFNSFSLTEVKPAPCPKGAYCILGFIPVTREFKVLGSEEDRCGSVRYQAFTKGAVLTVVDHAERTCTPQRKNRWEVILREPHTRGPRYFVGNPEAVQPVMACGIGDFICPMYYMPVTCSIVTVDGGATPISKLSAQGDNSCDARYELSKQLCAAGIDPTRMQDSDMICAVQVY